jgi:hypothetical protein
MEMGYVCGFVNQQSMVDFNASAISVISVTVYF